MSRYAGSARRDTVRVSNPSVITNFQNNMDKIRQREVIAQLCGWTVTGTADNLQKGNEDPHTGPVGLLPEGVTYVPGMRAYAGYGDLGMSWELPDYLNDLNAMHVAEECIPNNKRPLYWSILCNSMSAQITLSGYFCSIHASAEQRAKALLKTLDKWEEDDANT